MKQVAQNGGAGDDNVQFMYYINETVLSARNLNGCLLSVARLFLRRQQRWKRAAGQTSSRGPRAAAGRSKGLCGPGLEDPCFSSSRFVQDNGSWYLYRSYSGDHTIYVFLRGRIGSVLYNSDSYMNQWRHPGQCPPSPSFSASQRLRPGVYFKVLTLCNICLGIVKGARKQIFCSYLFRYGLCCGGGGPDYCFCAAGRKVKKKKKKKNSHIKRNIGIHKGRSTGQSYFSH